MGNITASGIWTPDEGDNLDPEVWSAAMAASIENGIGARLTKQEQAVGLKAGIAPGTTVGLSAGIIAPYEISGGEECFTQGLTLVGGVATVSVPGLYYISAAASLETTVLAPTNVGRSIALQVYKNVTQLVGCEVDASQHWATAQANCGINCIAGDTLSVHWYSAGPSGGVGTLTSNAPMNSLSIVLLTPVVV
jgi:hypothetical protein